MAVWHVQKSTKCGQNISPYSRLSKITQTPCSCIFLPRIFIEHFRTVCKIIQYSSVLYAIWRMQHWCAVVAIWWIYPQKNAMRREFPSHLPEINRMVKQISDENGPTRFVHSNKPVIFIIENSLKLHWFGRCDLKMATLFRSVQK